MTGRGRPRLRVGDHGNIKTVKLGARWRAATWVRDPDGKRRHVERTAETKTGATEALKDALDDRVGHGRELTRDTTVAQVAGRWLLMYQDMVDTGERAHGTLRVYRCVWEGHIEPAMGELRLGEASVTHLDRFVTTMRKRHGAAVTKTARATLNGILGYAVRHGAISRNPMADVSRIAGGRKSQPRALTAAERAQWLQRVGADEQAVSRDIPDLSLFLLGTGVRIAEALGVTFNEISFADSTVDIDYQIIRVKGKGLRRTRTKTTAGERTLALPDWVMVMLTRRYAELGEGPVFPAMRDKDRWRDPSNTSADFRDARTKAKFDWPVTSHTFRKTVATVLDDSGLSAREIADQLGHSRPSMTQDVYMGRGTTSAETAAAIGAATRPPAAATLPT
jgi:integrase